ncbi:MAG: hypothetical protein JW928_09485 [Candidatus Aureabacteria bacterium]|nr:hypothetical protein [Candidatus Auribacterota bacterium]
MKFITPLIILPYSTHEGPVNMALDEIFFSLANERKTIFFRFYGWQTPCVSFGYFQKPEKIFSCRIPSVRRLTGGGVVYHERDITFSLCGPMAPPFSNASGIYQFFSQVLKKAFSEFIPMGDIELTRNQAFRKKLYDCFESPVSGDILLKQKKIYGGALRKKGGAFLFQGTIQEPSLEKASRELMAHITEKLMSLFKNCTEAGFPHGIMQEAEQLARKRYLLDEWNIGKK